VTIKDSNDSENDIDSVVFVLNTSAFKKLEITNILCSKLCTIVESGEAKNITVKKLDSNPR